MLTEIIQKVATLHIGSDIVAGTLRILPGDRAVFVCARPPSAGTSCEMTISVPGSRTLRASVVVGKRTELGDRQQEIELTVQVGSKSNITSLRRWLSRAEGPQRRVLIIDDSELLNKMASAVLLGAGYHVSSTTSPFETYNCILKDAPDVVLVDYNIPALRGDELIEMAKRFGLNVPMVLYSSAPESVLREGMARSGALAYIRKGDPPEVLLERLDRVFRQIGWAEQGPKSSGRFPRSF